MNVFTTLRAAFAAAKANALSLATAFLRPKSEFCHEDLTGPILIAPAIAPKPVDVPAVPEKPSIADLRRRQLAMEISARQAAAQLGVGVQTYYNLVERDPEAAALGRKKAGRRRKNAHFRPVTNGGAPSDLMLTRIRNLRQRQIDREISAADAASLLGVCVSYYRDLAREFAGDLGRAKPNRPKAA